MLGALFGGAGIFYHYVIFLPNLERQKAESAKSRELSQRASYETCKSSALEGYVSDWADACKDVARMQANYLQNCLADRLIMSNPYMGKKYCTQSFGDIDSSPNCSLPKIRADSINKAYQEAQQRCLAEAKSNLLQ